MLEKDAQSQDGTVAKMRIWRNVLVAAASALFIQLLFITGRVAASIIVGLTAIVLLLVSAVLEWRIRRTHGIPPK